jgi:hypothetical protein
LAPDAFDLWLNCAEVDAQTAAALITPAQDDLFETYPVSTEVNRVANDNARLLEPVASGAPELPPAPKPKREKTANDGGQGALF